MVLLKYAEYVVLTFFYTLENKKDFLVETQPKKYLMYTASKQSLTKMFAVHYKYI